MTTTYATRAEAIEREILPALGEHVGDHNIEAIAEEVLVWHDEHTEAGDIWLPGRGFRMNEGVDFWAVVENHRRDKTPERLSGADLAVRRHLIGLTSDELADAFDVNPRTMRAWESGRDLIPERIAGELAALMASHVATAARMVSDGVPVGILRAKGRSVDRQSRGWYVAAAARALATDPAIRVEWAE